MSSPLISTVARPSPSFCRAQPPQQKMPSQVLVEDVVVTLHGDNYDFGIGSYERCVSYALHVQSIMCRCGNTAFVCPTRLTIGAILAVRLLFFPVHFCVTLFALTAIVGPRLVERLLAGWLAGRKIPASVAGEQRTETVMEFGASCQEGRGGEIESSGLRLGTSQRRTHLSHLSHWSTCI